MANLIKEFDTAYCVLLGNPYGSRIYKAVNHRHALAIALKVIPDHKDYYNQSVEVFEWLKPFNSRKMEFVDEDLQFVINSDAFTKEALEQASLSRVYLK